jgi:hypothetical protein
MSTRSAEFLVLLDDEGEGLERLRRSLRVTHVASPRLAVVEGPPGAGPEALRAIDGVAAIASSGESLDVASALTAEETLFADAWSLRTGGDAETERPGEGLAWDAPGFTPPDPPPSEG